MSPTTRRVRHALRVRRISVQRVEILNPLRRRITFAGDLHDLVSLAPDDHIKLVFPAGPGKPLLLPEVAGDRVRFAPGTARPPMRDFTPYRVDHAAGELTIEFVLHGSGPAAAWASAARPGDVIGQVGPRGSFVVDDARSWVILGDASALAAIDRRLREMPREASGTALIHVQSAAERRPLAGPRGVAVRWIVHESPDGDGALLQALCDLPPLAEETFVWGGAEAGVAQRIRAHLRETRAHTGDLMRVTGYWRIGTANHHD